MSADVNKTIHIGRLCADPEFGYTGGEDPRPVAKGRLACNTKYGNHEHELFLNIVFFGPLAEIVNKYCRKGSLLYCEGRLDIQYYKDKHGNDRTSVEARIFQMRMLDRKQEG